MKSKFTRLNRSELEFFIDNCNFSEEEIVIFKMTCSGNSEIEIAEKINLSISSVVRKKRKILEKISDFVEELENLTTIYLNGNRITKNELLSYEIEIEKLKKLLLKKLMN